ncbi:MAG: hypothetical protein ACK4P3_05170 [Fimbriimonadaceae bacterium]
MKNLNRTCVILLSVGAILCLFGCGGGDAPPPAVDTKTIQEAPPQPPVSPDGIDPR